MSFNMMQSQFIQEAQNRGWDAKPDTKAPQGGHSVATKDGVTMHHWESTNTVRTTMDHPKFSADTHWNKDCERKGLSDNQVKQVLENPRTHTGQGDVHWKAKN